MFGFGQRPLPQRIFEQARTGNLNALQQSTASLPDVAPAHAPTVSELEYIDRDGRTALCVAAQKGNVAVARLLISKGANINACSNKRDGGTPLHEASTSASSPEMINLLLNSGASPFLANTRGTTCYDIAIDRKVPTLVRRFESAAKIGAFVGIKVPGRFGFGGEFREFWGVLFQRLPNPAVPPERRVAHSQLFLFPTYNDPTPVARLWTDGAQVATLQNGGRNGATAVLMLHQQHQKPMHVFVDYDATGRPCVFLRPSTKPNHGGSVVTLASCINDTTAAAAAAHRAATGAPLPGTTPGAPSAAPQYTPSATSSTAGQVESAAESAWALATAAATSVTAMAGSVLASTTSSGQPRPQPAVPVAPSAPPVPSMQAPAHSGYGGQVPGYPPAGYVTPQYHVPGYSVPIPAAPAAAAQAAPQPAAATAPVASTSTTAAAATAPLSSTPDEPAPDGEEPCIVCLENKKSIGFLHQGTMHLCACRGCAEKWFQEHKTCPMCNMPADTLVPVFS